ncbi:RNA-directed DNA polymerase, eukaryota [Tanacetum coccineum]
MKENNEAEFIKKARTHEVQSEDPFEIYDLFKKKATKEATQDDDPSHPPGFMPKDDAAKEKEEAAYSVNQFSNNGNSLNKATKEATQDDDPSHPPGFTPKDDAAKEKEEAAYSVNQFSNNGNSLNNGVSRVHSGVNRSFSLKSGGSIMDVIENLVDIGQTMGYNMEGCLGQSTKKRWIRELNMKNKINFAAFQETKLESIDLFSIKELWGNFSFDFTFSPSVGFSGGILCVWDPNIFVKDNATISDSFVAVRGDFNEVRSEHERLGTIFNVSGAKAFNHFISASGLIDLPLEGHLSDHRPIIMREVVADYGPSPFRVYHSWFTTDGFDKLVEDSWKTSNDKQRSSEYRLSIQSRLSDLDKMFDSGHSNEDLVNERTSLLKELHNINKCHSLDMASKDKPYKVKNEFLNHFSNRFARPTGPNIVLDSNMFKQLSSEQIADLECDVTYDEIKRAVWDCGTNKSPGPDGFTFDFIRTYWKIINQDVVNAVREFFVTSKFPPGSNSSFIALIPKKQDANDVQSAFVPNRQILDGPFILNELISWCKFHKSKAMIFKVDFEKAFDSVRWDYLDGILSNFGFGSKWREWIHGCLTSAMGSILVNGSPTSEFKFHKGLKQGDPLSPFLFILVMESLHLSFNNILNAGLFKGIRIDDSLTLSHLFYADDAVFIGVSQEEVRAAASIIGCSTFSNPFTYLGVKVGMSSSKRKSWDEVIAPMGVLRDMESFRRRFFNGIDKNERKISMIGSVLRSSPWNCIIRELSSLSSQGINLLAHLKKKVGNGVHTSFWEDSWINDTPLSQSYPRLYALENKKHITVTEKISEATLIASFRRAPRGGVEEVNSFSLLSSLIQLFSPTQMIDGCVTQFLCLAGESCSHLFFSCSIARLLWRKVARWWDFDIPEFSSYEEWITWFKSIRIPKVVKDVLEGVFYVMWWVIWNFRNQM